MTLTPGLRGLAAMLALLGCAAVEAAEGRIVTLDGGATIQRRGKPVEATSSLAVEDGDELKVAKESRLQLQMRDDSILALAGPSVLKIESYQVPVSGNPGHISYSLKQGAVHTITGKINKGGGKYQMRTPLAAITVDGSEYAAYLCNGCGTAYADGLYVGAAAGTITVTNDMGSVALAPGQSAYVAAGKAPVLIASGSSPLSSPAVIAQLDFDNKAKAKAQAEGPPRIEREKPASPS